MLVRLTVPPPLHQTPNLHQHVGATTASAVNYVVPVTAVVISVLLLGEPVTWNLLVGGLVVLAGVAYAENRVRQFRRDPARHLTVVGSVVGSAKEVTR